MKSLIALAAFLVLCLQFNSCTVQKRVHRKGWHVEWKKNYGNDRSSGDKENFQSNTDKRTNKQELALSETVESTQTTPEPIQVNTNNSEDPKPSNNLQSVDHIELESTTEINPQAHQEVNRKDVEPASGKVALPRAVAGPIAILILSLAALFLLLIAGASILAAWPLLAIMAFATFVLLLVLRSDREGRLLPNVFYTLLLFGGILVILGLYFASIGAFSGTSGLALLAVLLVLIGLMVLLMFAVNSDNFKEKNKAQEEKEEKNASPEEKKKKTTKLIIVSAVFVGFVLLLVALLNS